MHDPLGIREKSAKIVSKFDDDSDLHNYINISSAPILYKNEDVNILSI